MLERPKFDGYRIRRLNHFLGHPIRFGPWRNDDCLRLFRRDGFVVVRDALDYETGERNWTLVVRVSDDGSPALSSTAVMMRASGSGSPPSAKFETTSVRPTFDRMATPFHWP